MPRPVAACLALLLAVGCEPAPEAAPEPTPDTPDASTLARCLLDGGQLETAWSVQRDASGITALAVAEDGTIAWGEGLGAVGRLPGALAEGSPEDPTDHVLPAGGYTVTGLAFTDDGALVAGNARGEVYAERGDDYVWTEVSDEPIHDVAALSDGSHRLAWVDGGFSGRPTLLGWDQLASEYALPPAVETELWQAHGTAFTPDGSRWILAGDWYGLPAIDLRDSEAPRTGHLGWTAPEAQGTFHDVVSTADGDRFVAVGSSGEQGHLMVVDREAFDDSSLASPGPDPAHRLLLEDHQPVAAHLLPGDEVVITRGTEGTVVAWTVDGLERLGSLAFEDAAASAIDPEGEVLLIGERVPQAPIHGVICTAGG